VAVTVTPFSTDGANARQISAVPFCTLVLSTSTQVRPPPATCVTVVFGEETPSAEINASSSSLPEVVEKAGVLTVVLAVPWSLDVVVSIPIAPNKGRATIRARIETRQDRFMWFLQIGQQFSQD